jgi:hypothetical protein
VLTCGSHGELMVVVSEMRNDVSEIKEAVVGSFSGGGLVNEVNEIKKDVEDLKGVKAAIMRVVWRLAIIGAVGSCGVLAAIKVFL